MKTISGLIVSLVMISAIWAQGEGGQVSCPECCWIARDYTCDNTANCDNLGGETVLFTPCCTTNYIFMCKTVCSGVDACHVCASCSILRDVTTGQVVLGCNTAFGGGACEGPCTGTFVVNLDRTHEYKLSVELRRCSDISDCVPCADCHAAAEVRHSTGVCQQL